jgi:hypothetical protein
MYVSIWIDIFCRWRPRPVSPPALPYTFPHAPLPYTRANIRAQPCKRAPALRHAHACQHAVTLACKHCDSHTRTRAHTHIHSIAYSVRCSVTHSLAHARKRTPIPTSAAACSRMARPGNVRAPFDTHTMHRMLRTPPICIRSPDLQVCPCPNPSRCPGRRLAAAAPAVCAKQLPHRAQQFKPLRAIGSAHSDSYSTADPRRRCCPVHLRARRRACACARASMCGWRTRRRALLARAARYRHHRPRALDRRRHCAEYSRAPCGGSWRAGGPSRAPLCAGFADGAANTNACPPGSSKIGSEAACAGAAAAVGRAWGGSVTYADVPSGCSYADGNFVFFNPHPTGRPRPGWAPLCAGKPPLHRSA